MINIRQQLPSCFLFACAMAVLELVAGTSFAVAQDFPEQKVHRAGFEPISDDLFDVVRQFFDYDRSYPLAGRTVERWEENGVAFEKIVFTTSNGERIPGNLAIPANDGSPAPTVLLVHGLGSSKERWERPDRSALRDSLLKAGVAVFAVDLQFHGERSSHNDYQSPVFLTFGDSLFIRSRNMVIQSTIDVRRALDYVATRPELDRSRVGVVGYSMGGMIALNLAGLEPGLSAIVVCAVPTTTQPVPIDHFNFAARATTPALLQIGKDDWLSSPDDAQVLRGLLPSDSELRLYDSGHRLPSAFAIDAAKWLRKRL